MAEGLIATGIPPLANAKIHPRFKAELSSVMTRAGGVRRLGAAYVRFAVEHAAHFRVMSGPVVARRREYPSLDAATWTPWWRSRSPIRATWLSASNPRPTTHTPSRRECFAASQ